MRFRTHISNVPLFHRIARSLAALAKSCIIRLSEDKVHFIIPGNENKDGVQVWSQVKKDTLFREFRIESNNNNEIWIELHLDPLLKILRSAESCGMGDSKNMTALDAASSAVTLKLNKKGNQAIWGFDIRGVSQHSGRPMSLSHEIDVHVLSQKRQGELNEPLCPPPDIHIILPPLTDLRNIVGRLSHLSDNVKVSANNNGDMTLDIKSKSAEMQVEWKKLHIPATDPDPDAEPAPKETFYSATVSIRAMLRFLTSHLVGGTAIACELPRLFSQETIKHLEYGQADRPGEINEAGGVLTFFIPAKTFGDDD